jgi:hypothetical protein
MGRNPYRVLGASLNFAFCAVAVMPALAADPACTPVNAAMLTLRTKPFHLFMTETRTYANPALAKAAGQIGLSGTKQSEEISTAKSTYVMTGGKWIDMQTSFAEMEMDKDTDSDTKKAMDAAR